MAKAVTKKATAEEIVDNSEIETTDSEEQKEEIVIEPTVEVEPESSEVLFLKRILHIQHEGGFGRHLDDIINERINELKK